MWRAHKRDLEGGQRRPERKGTGSVAGVELRGTFSPHFTVCRGLTAQRRDQHEPVRGGRRQTSIFRDPDTDEGRPGCSDGELTEWTQREWRLSHAPWGAPLLWEHTALLEVIETWSTASYLPHRRLKSDHNFNLYYNHSLFYMLGLPGEYFNSHAAKNIVIFFLTKTAASLRRNNDKWEIKRNWMAAIFWLYK